MTNTANAPQASPDPQVPGSNAGFEPVAFVLASASPARASTLRSAGIDPLILPTDIDEPAVLNQAEMDARARGQELTPGDKVGVLAAAKARAATPTGRKFATSRRALLVGCDSLLEFEGEMLGKPHTPDVAFARIRELQGNDATLWTGHHVQLLEFTPTALTSEASADEAFDDGVWRVVGELTRSESTVVHFGEMSDAEISAYVATGEPLEVAGSFTIDGLGGAFLRGVTGDPHSVVGISLPLLRVMASELGVFWPSLWSALPGTAGSPAESPA